MTVIAVLGAGNIGATLARKWTTAGHQVTLASRSPDAPALRDLAAGVGAHTASHADAVRDAEVVLVALPARSSNGSSPTSASARYGSAGSTNSAPLTCSPASGSHSPSVKATAATSPSESSPSEAAGRRIARERVARVGDAAIRLARG
jgi:NAD(P)-dependent dehydrogenase (short-subunit alcohol dehydrogenase family)